MSTHLVPAAVSDAMAALAERLRPSVVEVHTGHHGAGSGIVWREDGVIVTNHHVVPRDVASVVGADGQSFHATVTARDPHNDLAVLRIGAHGLPAVAVRPARTLRTGELVLAMGHPLGVKGAVSAGIVMTVPGSEDRRSGARELVQADVMLAPGNSGGPLVDARGLVVGINAMVAGGLALAVPSHLAERLAGGHTGRRVLGLHGHDVALPSALATRAPAAASRCIVVIGVVAGGPAEAAGLMIGDLIVAADGTPLEDSETFMVTVEQSDRSVVRLDVLRGGHPREVTVRLQGAPPRAA